MSTQVATVAPSLIGNVYALLRQRQRSLVKRGKANPAMAMLALTAVLYFWLGRMRAKKGPPRGKAVPHLKTNLFMIDVAFTYVRARANGEELKFVQDLSKQGLTITTEFVGHCLILAFEPSSVQHILVKNFENYPKGPAFHRAFSPFMGTGIFNADGAAWKNQRALARPHFQVTEYKGAAHIETQINQVCGIVDKAIANGDVIDVQDLWSRYTIDTATGFLFGNCVNALDVPQQKFVSAFNYTQKVCGWKIRLCEYQNLFPAPSFPQKVKDMDEVLLPIVDQAIAKEMNRRVGAGGADDEEHKHDNLLQHFLNSVDENGKPFDRIYLRDMLMNFLLAGRDTSTNLLTFMFYNLGKNPDVMERVREEIFSVDAEEFDPDRWGPERVKMVRPFMFFPFHAGPRICLGQNFAYNQAMNTMTRMLQRYTWKVIDGFVPKPESDITMYSRNGMHIIFDEYKD
ncbi:hypothetical protein BGW38_006676 [Lunasporangiospora selenospora]|uniref:Cytochrome P450 n=1 Tax=Lunasporangiospora selenospora TaxID=979761 RepID=A0A9P6FNE5_9FUNG|nr:hypothetical protein BGW38_006676 [Lunasporangiospora selenospora]